MTINYPRTMYVDADADADQASYRLCLYINGQSDRSIVARQNLRRLCEEHLGGRYELEIVDLAENPRLAAADGILATPTLLRRLPRPVKRIVGDLSDTEKLLQRLDIRKRTRIT